MTEEIEVSTEDMEARQQVEDLRSKLAAAERELERTRQPSEREAALQADLDKARTEATEARKMSSIQALLLTEGVPPEAAPVIAKGLRDDFVLDGDVLRVAGHGSFTPREHLKYSVRLDAIVRPRTPNNAAPSRPDPATMTIQEKVAYIEKHGLEGWGELLGESSRRRRAANNR